MTADLAAMREESDSGSFRKPSFGGSRAVAAAKLKLDDPAYRPVVRLINLLGGLQGRYPENFRKAMETLRESLAGKLTVELRDGRRFATIGPLAIPRDVFNDKTRNRPREPKTRPRSID